MILGKPLKTALLVIGGLAYTKGDSIFEFVGRRTLLGMRNGRHTVAWNDDRGVPLTWSHEDKWTAYYVAIWVAEHQTLPPSQRRKTRTLTGLEPVRKAV
jgi:hypothetical protein